MRITKWLIWAVALVVLAITIPGYRSHIFFLNFVDEDDNIVIGNYVREGKKLYTEVFSQHQPSLFILSSEFQKVASADNILMVVKRHREFMIAWSILWVLIVTARFGWTLLLPASVIELTKITLLGNLFLAESLVVYPLLYLIAYIFEEKKSKKVFENWIIGIIFWLLWFSLTPLWPLLLICYLLIVFKSQDKKSFILISLLIVLVSILYMSQFIGIREYFYDALYINYRYYIPFTTRISPVDSLVKAFLAPVYSLFAHNSGELLRLIQILSIGFIINISYLIYDKKYLKAALITLILGLTSLRYIEPDTTLYSAFHMLPWFALLIFFKFHDTSHFKSFSPTKRIVKVILFTLIIASSLNIARMNLWDSRDINADFYVHYSPSVDIRQAVSILSKNESQTLWVEPVMYWPHWRASAHSYSTMVNYYGWMDQTTPMKEEIEGLFQSELPTIVWADTTQGIGRYLNNYTRFERDDKPINLYLRNDKVDRIDASTRSELEYYRFKIN